MNLGSRRAWLVMPWRLWLVGSAVILQAPGHDGMSTAGELIGRGPIQSLNAAGAIWCTVTGGSGDVVAMTCDYPRQTASTWMLWTPGRGTHPLLHTGDVVLGAGAIGWLDSGAGGRGVTPNEAPIGGIRWPT